MAVHVHELEGRVAKDGHFGELGIDVDEETHGEVVHSFGEDVASAVLLLGAEFFSVGILRTDVGISIGSGGVAKFGGEGVAPRNWLFPRRFVRSTARGAADERILTAAHVQAWHGAFLGGGKGKGEIVDGIFKAGGGEFR